MSLKWKYKPTLDAYQTKQKADLKSLYDGLAETHTDRDKKTDISNLHQPAERELATLNDRFRNLISTFNFTKVTSQDVLNDFLGKQKTKHLEELKAVQEKRLAAVDGLPDTFKADEKDKLKKAITDYHEEEKKAANEHFEKAKKEVEEYNHALGRMESFGYVQARILKPSGEEAPPAGIGPEKAEEAFKAFQNDGAKRLHVGGRILDVMSSPDGKVSIKLPPPIMMGNEGKFAADLVNLLHAKGCDAITFEGNVSRKVKLEVWRLANLKEPPMSVSGDFAPTPKEQQALQEEKQKRQQPQQPTPSANTSTPTGPRPGNSSGN